MKTQTIASMLTQTLIMPYWLSLIEEPSIDQSILTPLKSVVHRYTSSAIIIPYNSISSKSRIRQAVCALLAASATRLKS